MKNQVNCPACAVPMVIINVVNIENRPRVALNCKQCRTELILDVSGYTPEKMNFEIFHHLRYAVTMNTKTKKFGLVCLNPEQQNAANI